MITWRRVGLEFIDENGGGPGVRLKKLKREKAAGRDSAPAIWRNEPKFLNDYLGRIAAHHR
jgi:hypothetical protein